MRLEQIIQILKINEQKSLSKAAQELFISQPSLSVSVSRLEDEVGFKIFERSRAGVALTEQGEEFIRLAHQIQDLGEQISGVMEGKIRTIQMAIPAIFADYLVPELLERLRLVYPEVNLYVHETRYHEILDLMDKGAYSMGIITGWAEQEKPLLKQIRGKSMACEIIPGGAEAGMMLFLSGRNPLAAKRSVCLEELSGMRMIRYKDFYSPYVQQMKPSSLKSVIVEDIEFLKRLVSEDFGYSIFPVIFQETDIYVESGLIRTIPIAEFSGESPQIYVVHPGRESLSLIEKDVLALVVELITEKIRP